MNYGIWQGAERATGNIANAFVTGMGIQANKQIAADRMAIANAELKINQDKADREATAFGYQEKKLKEQEASGNRLIDITTQPQFLALPEDQRPNVLNYFASNGFTDETGKGKNKDVLQGLSNIEKSKDLFTNFMKPVIDQKQKSVIVAWDELSQAKATADPKKIQTAQAKFDQLNGDYHQSIGKFDEHVKSLTEEQGKEKLKQMEIDAKVPRSDTDNEIIAKALSGDKVSIAILNKKQEMRNENARESRSQPQQTQFIDPASGNPLIYDRATNTYKVATVEGGGGAAPRFVNPSAGEREKGAQFEVIRDQLKRIKSEYKSRYVGLVAGQLGRVTQWGDADEAAFRQVILDVKDSLLRARSGAQINEQEYKRLSKLVPDFTDSEPQFAGKMKSFETTFDNIVKERERAQRKGGVYIRGEKTSLPEGLTKGW